MSIFQDSLTIAPIATHAASIPGEVHRDRHDIETQERQPSLDRRLTAIEQLLKPAHGDTHDAETRKFQRTVESRLARIENLLKPAQPSIDYSQSINLLIEWIAVRSISFRAIESDLFKEFVRSLHSQFLVPSHRILKQAISDMANIQITIPASTTRSFCSIMIDGATKFNHILLAVILFFRGQIHFLDLVDLPDQKSETIARRVAPLIQKLSERNLIVTAVCTDNASNEKAILDSKHDFALQTLTGLPILRLPCAAHTLNLAMTDFLKSSINSQPSILQLLQTIIQALPKGFTSPFHTMPRLNEARWLSCGDVIMYLLLSHEKIETYFVEKRLEHARSCLQTLHIPDLAQVFTIFTAFLFRLESNSAVYSQVFPTFAHALSEFEHLPNNRYRSRASLCLCGRFGRTADFSHIVAIYLLSPVGRKHIRESVRTSFYAGWMESFAREGIRSLCAIFHIESDNVIDLFLHYLWEMGPETMPTREFWAHFPKFVTLRESGCTSAASLIELGERMAEFPATECSCERIFCQVRNLVGDFRQHMKSGTLRDLVRIRMHRLWQATEESDIDSVAARLRGGVDDESTPMVSRLALEQNDDFDP
jgi:hypothetical protein